MKFPKEVNSYCPSCKKHTKQKARIAAKGKSRTLAAGNLAHQRALTGHGGKRAGKVSVKKQGKQQKITLECSVCKKKHERVLHGGKTKKKVEFR